MRVRKPGEIVAICLWVLALCALIAGPALAASPAHAPNTPRQRAAAAHHAAVLAAAAEAAEARAARQEALLDEKERAETKKLHAETHNATGVRGLLSNYAALATALVALAGLALTLRGQNREQSRQRTADREQREKDREQREAEGNRELSARFSQLLLDLGSTSEPVQAGAAVSLLTFLTPEVDPSFYRQVRLAVLANLKVEHPPAVIRLLVRTFEQALAIGGERPFDPIELDFSAAQLSEAMLSNLTLDGANLSETELARCDLSNTSLRDCHGTGVNLSGATIRSTGEGTASLFNARLPKATALAARFDGAELVNAHLREANLRDARFNGARMQAAHLEDGTDLRGARFERANIADTWFRGALFDEPALRSLARAENWEQAHFDENHRLAIAHYATEARP
jgi:uncharacterized protein YjbI with pentapeptide repeats